jgi:hypothetical protein
MSSIPREGGTFRVTLTYDAPGEADKSSSGTDTYHGFVRLVPTGRWWEVIEFETADPALARPMTLTTALTDADGGTEIVIVHDGIPASVPPADTRQERGWRWPTSLRSSRSAPGSKAAPLISARRDGSLWPGCPRPYAHAIT